MNEGRYYVGEDLKFKITLTAEGFDQGQDPYEIDFYCGDNSVMHFTQADMKKGTDGDYYLLIDTKAMQPGVMRMVITAHIPDNDFDDHYRDEVESISLGPLRPVK
jgi:hypothetical protein